MTVTREDLLYLSQSAQHIANMARQHAHNLPKRDADDDTDLEPMDASLIRDFHTHMADHITSARKLAVLCNDDNATAGHAISHLANALAHLITILHETLPLLDKTTANNLGWEQVPF